MWLWNGKISLCCVPLWVAYASMLAVVAFVPVAGGPPSPPPPQPASPLGGTTPHSIANQSIVTLCYLYYGSLDDLGWTYSYNLGRLKAHDALREKFPNRAFVSRYVQNVALLSTEERLAVIDLLLSEARCDVLMHNSLALLSFEETRAVALRYPHVFVAVLNEYQMTNTSAQSGTLDNVLFLANDYTSGFYAAGAAAGAQVAEVPNSCIAFLAAWSSEVDPTSAFAGFLLGVRASHPTVPVHVISLDSWNDAEADKTLTKLFVVDHGCTIVARYTDPFAADQLVQSMALPDVFSIGPHSNLQQYVGDTVLTAVFVDWSVAILGVLEPLLTTGRWDRSRVHFYGAQEGAVQAAPLSPRASDAAVDAFRDAMSFVARHESAGNVNSSVICGTNLTLRTGRQLVPSRLMQPQGSTRCKISWANLADFLIDDYVVAHPTFTRGSAVCQPGESYRYAFTPLLSLLCEPCPVDTYAPLPVPAGGCLPCPTGSTTTRVPAGGGAAACVAVVDSPSSRGLSTSGISGVAVAAFLVGCVVVSMAAFVCSAWAPHRDAPTGEAPLCLMWLDIEASQSLKRMLQPKDGEGDGASWHTLLQVYETTVRSVVQRSGSGAYESVHSETRFTLVFPSAFDALAGAVDLQEALMSVTGWPAAVCDLGGPKVRICLHHCLTATRSFDFASCRFVYDGVDPAAGAALSEIALGGMTICAQETLDEVLQDPAYGLLLAHEITIHSWGVAPLPRSRPATQSAAGDRDHVPLFRIVSKRAEAIFHEKNHRGCHLKQPARDAANSDFVLLRSAKEGAGALARAAGCSRITSQVDTSLGAAIRSPFAVAHHAASSGDAVLHEVSQHTGVPGSTVVVVEVPSTRLPCHSPPSDAAAGDMAVDVDRAIPSQRLFDDLPPGADPQLHQDCWSFDGYGDSVILPKVTSTSAAVAAAAEGYVVQRLLQHVSTSNSAAETSAFVRQLCRALGLAVADKTVPMSTRRVAAAAAARLNPGSLEAVIAAVAAGRSHQHSAATGGGVGHNPLRSPRSNSLWSVEYDEHRRECSVEFPLIAFSSALRPAQRACDHANRTHNNNDDDGGEGAILLLRAQLPAAADLPLPLSTHQRHGHPPVHASDFANLESTLEPSASVPSADVPMMHSMTPAAPTTSEDEIRPPGADESS